MKQIVTFSRGLASQKIQPIPNSFKNKMNLSVEDPAISNWKS